MSQSKTVTVAIDQRLDRIDSALRLLVSNLKHGKRCATRHPGSDGLPRRTCDCWHLEVHQALNGGVTVANVIKWDGDEAITKMRRAIEAFAKVKLPAKAKRPKRKR